MTSKSTLTPYSQRGSRTRGERETEAIQPSLDVQIPWNKHSGPVTPPGPPPRSFLRCRLLLLLLLLLLSLPCLSLPCTIVQLCHHITVHRGPPSLSRTAGKAAIVRDDDGPGWDRGLEKRRATRAGAARRNASVPGHRIAHTCVRHHGMRRPLTVGLHPSSRLTIYVYHCAYVFRHFFFPLLSLPL